MPTKARQRGDPRLLDGVSPSWTKLEPIPPPTGKSGLTSSDDQPRYRRGSRRRPKPPKTPPGLVQLEHPSLAVAHFDGKGKGYAAVAPIQASALLLQERPLTVAGAFDPPYVYDQITSSPGRYTEYHLIIVQYSNLGQGEDLLRALVSLPQQPLVLVVEHSL